MTANEYQEKAMATLNPALSRKDVLINSVMGQTFGKTTAFIVSSRVNP